MLRSSRAISVWARDSQDKCKSCSIKDILGVYAKRWRIENKLAELVAFFNLNALSSPIMIRIHFDILWTLIADTLYHRFAHDLRRFDRSNATNYLSITSISAADVQGYPFTSESATNPTYRAYFG